MRLGSPTILGKSPPDEPHHVFRRGRRYPRANAWFGFTSFWGHLVHLGASAIATEDIDARDWMWCLPADALTSEVARILGLERAGASLTERLGEDLWIDYLADTGDDADVGHAVASLIFQSYRSDDEVLPRGRILLFGGDTAYPVATDLEIHNRVCVPFNLVLKERADPTPRVLLGIPGNHDWYNGLDGFGRMFKARKGRVDRVSEVADSEVDRTGQIGHLFQWVEAFRVGHSVAKRSALPLLGYSPAQSASYFCLRLAPALDLWGVDRQLRDIDYTQRSFFMHERGAAPDHGVVLMVSDPAHTMLEPHAHGQRILEALDVDLEADAPMVLTGDTHHYCRQHFGDALHVVAGGGGAFLHPARILRRGLPAPAAEFPGPRSSAALALQVPWQLALGRSGYIAHAAVAALHAPFFGLELAGLSSWPALAVAAAVAGTSSALLAGWRKKRKFVIGALALLCGAWIAATAPAAAWAMHAITETALPPLARAGLALVASVIAAVLGFGTFLMILTLLGLEHHHAFSTLAHPGYKHFVRLRVRRDGSAVDGWVIGKVDTLDPEAEIVLVDRFTWNNPRHGVARRAHRKEA